MTTTPVVQPQIYRPEPEPEPEPQIAASAPGLLNERERKRMDLAMAGLSQFRPVAELQRPTPRSEVDSLSSVSAADWSGLDGMGEELGPRSRPAPAPAAAPPRREPVVAPVRNIEPVSEPEPVSVPMTDPARGWVTADRLFSDFGD